MSIVPKSLKPTFLVLALIGLALLAGVAAGVLFLGRPRVEAGPEPASPNGKRTLVVVGESDFPPFTFLRNGEAAGFDVDLITALAQRKGLSLDIRLMSWTEATEAIREGKADILLGVSDLEERRSWLSFSERMLTMKSSLFAATDTYSYTRVQDLGPDVPLGVQKGDIVSQYLRSTFPAIQQREYPSVEAAMEALARREIEFAAVDYYSGLLSLQRLRLRARVKILGDAILEAAYCLGVGKGKEGLLIPLNDGLEILKADGTIASLTDRWLGTGGSRPTSLLYVLYGLAIAASSAVVLLAWNLSLRRAVAQRTKELQETNEVFRLYMEYSPVYMYIKDEGLRIKRLSKNFEGFYHRPLGELLGATSRQLMDEASAERVDKYDRKVLAELRPLELLEEIRGRMYSSIRFPIIRAEGEPYLAGFLLDITEKTQSEAKVLKSLKEKETLIRELHHRTKNTLQVIRGIVLLEGGEFPENQEIQALVKKTEDRIQAIALVHQMLYKSQNLSRLSIKTYIEELSRLVLAGFEGREERIGLVLDLEEAQLLLDVAIPLGLVINELLTNSLVHAFPQGRAGTIRIAFSATGGDDYVLHYEDNGVGFPANFDFRGQVSLGLRLVFSIGEDQLQGKVAMEGGKGASVDLRFRDNLYEERV